MNASATELTARYRPLVDAIHEDPELAELVAEALKAAIGRGEPPSSSGERAKVGYKFVADEFDIVLQATDTTGNYKAGDVFENQWIATNVSYLKKRGKGAYTAGLLVWWHIRYPKEAKSFFANLAPPRTLPEAPDIPGLAVLLRRKYPKEIPSDTQLSGGTETLSMFMALRGRFERRASELLEEYEPNGLVDDFLNYMSDAKVASGYWALTAGPGIGKSAIFADIKKRMSDRPDCACIYFPFLFGDADAKFSTFYKFALSALEERFSLGIDLPQDELSARNVFFSLLGRLKAEGSIGSNHKLVLLIDAVDEMQETTRVNADETNPLELPSSLPEGVFIAFSRRQRPREESKQTPFSRDIRSVRVDLAEKSTHLDIHKKTTRNYVERCCKQNDFIWQYRAFDNVANEEKQKKEFVLRICEGANFSFSILRGVLNDPEFWRSETSHRPIPATVEQYYEDLFASLSRQGGQGLGKFILLCLSLRPRVSNFVFLRLIGGSMEDAASLQRRDEVKAIFESWIKQGLVLRERFGDVHWYSPYHSTFREFLHGKLREEDRYDFANRFSFNLVEGQNVDGGLDYIKSQPPEIIEDWVSLTIALLLHLENCARLRELIGEKSFWVLCSKSKSGVLVAIDAMKRLQPSPGNVSEFSALYRESAQQLVDWVYRGEIEPKLGEKRKLGDLYDMTRHADYTGDQGGAVLRFPREIFYSKVEQERLTESDVDLHDEINRLLGLMKENMRAKQLEAALNDAAELETLFVRYSDLELRSRYLYDRGMIYHARGEYDKSIIDLKESSDAATSAGKMLSAHFSRYRCELGRYLIAECDLDEAYDHIASMYTDAKDALPENSASSFAENLLYNTAVSLSHLAFENRSHRFEHWVSAFLETSMSRDSLEKPNAIYEFYRYQAFARKCMLYGDFERAAETFSLYLGFEWPKNLSAEKDIIPPDRLALIKGVAGDILEIGRDYRDLARSILKCERLGDERMKLAQKVWDVGLAMPDVRGHRRFLREMAEDMSEALPIA